MSFSSPRVINDTIYKHIQCSSVEERILQTKTLNRLLFITQNALAYFAFPSINTKRYIHSIGTMEVAGHMFQNALLNAEEQTRQDFIQACKASVKTIIKENRLDVALKDKTLFEQKALYGFMLPLQSKKDTGVYLLMLQALRIAALVHDLGHLPFSHQVEDAMTKIYRMLSLQETCNDKQQRFLHFYNNLTKNGSLVLHEALGIKLVKMLFVHELDAKKDDRLHLLYLLVQAILQERRDKYFDYTVMHQFVDSTVDADRLDYVNRDMLASGYISGAADFIRIARQCVITEHQNGYKLCYLDNELLDIEHMLEMRFNLYKKIIFNHAIAATDAHLENVILFLARKHFSENNSGDQSDDISMMWRFLEQNDLNKRLDLISQLDENWLISIFKKEYFAIKYAGNKQAGAKKYLQCFEEVLFGKRTFVSLYRNLNELYNLLGFDKTQRYRFRESFGYVSRLRYENLQQKLDAFCHKHESPSRFLTYRIVSLNIGIEKDFMLYDGNELIRIDEISTLRKRLKKSIQNTVPFYLYSNKPVFDSTMKEDIKQILYTSFL